jgi:hypothetical protein
MGPHLSKSMAKRVSGNGKTARNVRVHMDDEHVAFDFTFEGPQRDESIRLSIHPEDFLQVAHRMLSTNKKAFLAAFAKAILEQDYR